LNAQYRLAFTANSLMYEQSNILHCTEYRRGLSTV